MPKVARKWTCPECKHRNGIGRKRTCENCGQVTRRARRSSGKGGTLREHDRGFYLVASRLIHGNGDGTCDVCGKAPSPTRQHDRDHSHVTGAPRGVACGGNRGCNVLMPAWVTAPVARAIATAKLREGEPDAERWALIADYLERVDAFYLASPEWLAYMEEEHAGT